MHEFVLFVRSVFLFIYLLEIMSLNIVSLRNLMILMSSCTVSAHVIGFDLSSQGF
jgi:hypothetical protein